jgi:hypothetical protein
VRGGEWQGDDAADAEAAAERGGLECLDLCRRVQREVVHRGVAELGFAYSCSARLEALAGALRAIVAIEADGSPRDTR